MSLLTAMQGNRAVSGFPVASSPTFAFASLLIQAPADSFSHLLTSFLLCLLHLPTPAQFNQSINRTFSTKSSVLWHVPRSWRHRPSLSYRLRQKISIATDVCVNASRGDSRGVTQWDSHVTMLSWEPSLYISLSFTYSLCWQPFCTPWAVSCSFSLYRFIFH